MPRINLLPAKKLQREEDLRQELRIVAILLAGCVLCLLAHQQAQASALEARRVQLSGIQKAAESYADKINQIEVFKASLKLLGKKVATIDALQAAKAGPSRMLGTFAEVLADHPRVWLNKFEQSGNTVRLSGNAMAQEDISHFQMALAARAPLLTGVSLELVSAAKDRTDRVLEWRMACTVHSASETP